ncbi:hypothetical protein MPSEU_000886000 [Mayamaea pseudoterrestris]|nr:hypothetical protein MPSEU_000886000 [Mayamaea pseudoterrestris]
MTGHFVSILCAIMRCLTEAFRFLLFISACRAFEWAAGGKRPDITHHEIAGLWRLTKPTPLKEFTVYPRKSKTPEAEILLMLKEDGSFQQYQNDNFDASEKDVDKSWKRFQQTSQFASLQSTKSIENSFQKGKWDFVDGTLLLAADRPTQVPSTSKEYSQRPQATIANSKQQDTLLVGRVIATHETSLGDDSATNLKNQNETQSQTDTLVQVDTRLSVPFGSIKVGKFFYPRNHPAFFDQPMYRPLQRETVCLRQVLGSLNARQKAKEEVSVEKYRRSDFYNKTFLLTSHPLRHNFQGKKRWSIKYNKYVYDKSDAVKKEEEDEAQRMANIRVMQVQFHVNNTFSTVAGLGRDVILRGKFDVIGHDRDQLWMQIWRFGFGRSVSGSVFSEGRSLTQDDAKTYWGSIHNEGENLNTLKGDQEALETTIRPECDRMDTGQRIEVKGSVLLGWGLEPLPVAQFIMREAREADIILDDDEDGDDDDDVDDNANNGFVDTLELLDTVDFVGADGIDMSGDDAFQ